MNIGLLQLLCGVNYQVEGLSELPNEPTLVLCNHQSTWETLFLQCLLPAQTWVLKKELMAIPLFGWGLRLLKPIAVDRSKRHSVKSLIEQGKQRLEAGLWLVLFPEGTRASPNQLKPFSRSGEALGAKTKAPVIVVAHDAGKNWPKNSFFKYPGTVRVFVKRLDKNGEKSITEQAFSFVQQSLGTRLCLKED